jgi:hypothetical protein
MEALWIPDGDLERSKTQHKSLKILALTKTMDTWKLWIPHKSLHRKISLGKVYSKCP